MIRSTSSSSPVQPAPIFAFWGQSVGIPHEDICTATVYLVGNMPESEELILKAGWNAVELASLESLPEGREISTPSCLIIDISRADLESSSLTQRLANLGSETPFICTTDEVNLALVVEIVKAGAIDVLPRSLSGEALLGAIRVALLRSQAASEQIQKDRQLRRRYDTLSARERQVMTLASSGLLNKQIAAELTISEITVKAHRGSAMRKMQAHSFAGLVKMAISLEL